VKNHPKGAGAGIIDAGRDADAKLKSRDRLFESAQKLFARKGFREVSVREIASDAGVNSALVRYHFGGKQQLFDEVYRSYADPLAMERMNRLAVLADSGAGMSVEDILKAWLLPWLETKDSPQQNARAVRFTANISAEHWKQNKKASEYARRAHAAFIDALHRCLPHLTKDTLAWRLHFIVGAIAFGIRDPDAMRDFSNRHCNPADLETALAQILPFALEGIGAPEPE
jgi:AcrR family transcriptional regulator